jgi:hypothetical protein
MGVNKTPQMRNFANSTSPFAIAAGWVAIDILVDSDSPQSVVLANVAQPTETITLKAGQSRTINCDSNGGTAMTLTWTTGATGSFVIQR